MPTFKQILDFIETLGLLKGVFALFFFMTHGWVYSLYKGRLTDRQVEINRLAEDNREYRERFLSILDKHYNYSEKRPKRVK